MRLGDVRELRLRFFSMDLHARITGIDSISAFLGGVAVAKSAAAGVVSSPKLRLCVRKFGGRVFFLEGSQSRHAKGLKLLHDKPSKRSARGSQVTAYWAAPW